jgi:hypothetical protein
MKTNKIILTILFLLASSVYGQSRYRMIDLSCRIHKPVDGLYIISPTTLEISYWVKNQGPDTVFKEDSFDLTVNIVGLDHGLKRFIQPGNIQLNPGDSILLNYKTPVNFKDDVDFVTITTSVLLKNSSPNFNFIRETSLNPQTTKDNTWRVIITHRSATSSIGGVGLSDLSISPNPVADKLHIELEKTGEILQAIQLHDLSGREIPLEPSNIVKLSNAQWELSLPQNIGNGIYTLEIKTEQGNYYKKILVQK